MIRFCVAALAVAILALPARAAIPPKAEKAYIEGSFVKAAHLAEAEGSAEALAFAARSRVADAIMRDGVYCIPCLSIAETIANDAIARDPNLAEGYTQFAIAMGFRGRLIGLMEASAEELPEKGRRAIDKALELDPLSPWARAALGAWHLEVVRHAGPVLAEITYGARRSDGLKAFRAALAVDPANLLLHFHFALSILALDVEEFRGDALIALQDGYKDARADALTKFTRARADKLAEALKTGTTEEIEALVRRYQGYPDD
jgi:hypothetical protein